MKIGLYFGSFNPIHHGHLIIASHILANTEVENIWFVVSPHNPLKESSSLLNEYHRLHLVRLAIDGEDRFRASDIEFHLPRPSYTIDTLTYLHEKYPQHEFSVIMGSDSLQNIAKWKNADVLTRNYRLLVYVRPNFPVTNEIGANLSILEAPMLEISSSYIRNCLKNQRSIRYLTTDNVVDEINKNRYYL